MALPLRGFVPPPPDALEEEYIPEPTPAAPSAPATTAPAMAAVPPPPDADQGREIAPDIAAGNRLWSGGDRTKELQAGAEAAMRAVPEAVAPYAKPIDDALAALPGKAMGAMGISKEIQGIAGPLAMRLAAGQRPGRSPAPARPGWTPTRQWRSGPAARGP